MGETSRQRWNRDQIPEMGSLDSLSMDFLQFEYRVRRRRRTPVLGYRKASFCSFIYWAKPKHRLLYLH